ncbi:MAG: integrase core domain-containing protein, partial [Fibromonadaceae bacterium]|nr:integrase core domain-containing protein [Fibromonadaceae bacterium]
RILLDVIEKFGKPKVIRTDNESVFTSRLFRFALWLLGIRHQRIMLHCPWQNGRVERFFGTFKSYADRVVFSAKYLQAALDEFVCWYNFVRPHRHLGGRTPGEAWSGVEPYERAPKVCRKFSGWDGMLRGYWMGYG